MLLTTVVIAYLMTFGSGALAYLTSVTFFPSMIEPDSYIAAEATASPSPAPFFTVDVPPLMSVTTSLVLAFVLGFGCAMLPSAKALKNVLDGFRDVIKLVIDNAIIPLLPIYIFGIFLDMTISGKVGPVLLTFVKIIAVIFCLHVGVLVLQYCIASIFSRKNPFKCLWTMMPAYFTALGTQSSAATIPVTLERTVAMGVDRDVADSQCLCAPPSICRDRHSRSCRAHSP